MKTKKNKGFTLIELMVVIAIMGIISSVAIPNLMSWYPDYRIRSASRGLYDNMQFARMSAIKARQACYLEFEASGYTVKMDSKTLKTINLADYGAGINLSDYPARITFQYNGLAGGSDQVKITNSNKTYSTTVSLSGAVKLEKL